MDRDDFTVTFIVIEVAKIIVNNRSASNYSVGIVVWPVRQCSGVSGQRVSSTVHAAAGGYGEVKG